MNLECDAQIAATFRSRSQQVRVATEAWFGSQSYCLACDSDRLSTSKPNAIARDFYCPLCEQSYELKSSERAEGKRIVDGAYATMLERIRARDAPALVLLRYLRNTAQLDPSWRVDRLVAIHPVFLTDAVVEPRKPLSPHARRAGWQGCNLRLDRVPPEGRIALVSEGKVADRSKTRALFGSSKRLDAIDPSARGWTATVLTIVRDIGLKSFRLSEVYAHRQKLEEAFPNNRHVEAKIRQQLQVLRDLGYLHFSSRGVYEVLS
jgi:type II restriction enzyme